MNPRMIEMMKAVRIPLELNAKPGDKVLIITDTRIDPEIWQALAAAANQLDMEPTITLMTPRAAHGYNPTTPILNAARDPELGLVIYLTSTAMAHCGLTAEMNKMGRKFILMEEVTPDMLLQGGPGYADYAAIAELGDKITALWSKGKHVRVQSALGTDLTAIIEGRPALTEAGKIRVAPELIGKKPMGVAFPFGESNTCPLEGSGEGTIVFDLTAHSVGWLKDPIRLTIEKGMVTKIEGGAEADKWREILEKHGDANSYNCPAEIAIGLNPGVTPTGLMRTDKKLYAASHIGIGDTITLGGTCHAKLRLEGVIKEPTITVDDQVIVKGGKILVE